MRGEAFVLLPLSLFSRLQNFHSIKKEIPSCIIQNSILFDFMTNSQHLLPEIPVERHSLTEYRDIFNDDRFYCVILQLQAIVVALLAEALDSRPIFDRRHNDFTVSRRGLVRDNDQILAQNPDLDHRVSLYL